MKSHVILLSFLVLCLDLLFLYIIQTGTNGHGLAGFLHLSSRFITEIPESHNFISVLPIFVIMAFIAATPVILTNRTKNGLIGFILAALFSMIPIIIFGERLPKRLDEYSIFSSGGLERSQLMRIHSVEAFIGRHGRVYSVEINPHHIEQRPYVNVSVQTYELVRNSLYQSHVDDPDHNGGWQTDYCLKFIVETVGHYERIVFPRHLITPGELVSCPKDAA